MPGTGRPNGKRVFSGGGRHPSRLPLRRFRRREPAYDHLNGTWAREEPYVVVHRLALSDAARGRGAAGTAFQLVEDLCRDRGVREFRVDTDAGNHKMQHILAKQGFQYRGSIRFDNSEKIAYEKLL
ncbi:GNAT family N-acetyltransferase [Dysosmobacter welbionis]|uniref:GNAT family N-acetyltransferase n=1 Tax=Dysosmobacter welbionis TaxID=2093857 RepID=UPI0023DF6AD9|nr:GNAT family N-acetyltransferase [Dysosmobacter welbionis]